MVAEKPRDRLDILVNNAGGAPGQVRSCFVCKRPWLALTMWDRQAH